MTKYPTVFLLEGYPVEQKVMRQWSMRIKAYAERLLSDLDGLDWTDSLKEQQKNWIGKSVGASVSFEVANHKGEYIEVFTTRPDTIFGVTFIVLAPEHELVMKIVNDSQSRPLKIISRRHLQIRKRTSIRCEEHYW